MPWTYVIHPSHPLTRVLFSPVLTRKMPYMSVLFDDAVEASMRDTANKIAAGSAFTPHEGRFHVPLLGSLHVYSQEALAQTTSAAPITLRGRFLKWEIRASQLRATVEFERVSELMSSLQQSLPRGRPWRTHYVSIGSMTGIDTALHDDFLAAVCAAFPIDTTLLFTASQLEYHDTPQHNLPMTTATKPRPGTLDPKAKPFVPKLTKPKPKLKPRARRHVSPHLKWDRETGPATGCSIDELIKTGSTGTAGRATQLARRNTLDRATKVQQARKVWMADPTCLQ